MIVVGNSALVAILRREPQVDTFLRYGKGRHPAALNLGDCASYALAKAHDLKLLFKGNDFFKTDIRSAV